MESAGTMVELGGEWSSFNGVSVNEEADFMAQLFPNSSLINSLDGPSNLFLGLSSSSSSCWTGHDDQSNIGVAGFDTNNSFYSSDHNTSDSNLYSSNFSQDSSYSGSGAYQCRDNYYMGDPHQILAVNTSSLPFDFCMSGANCADLEQSGEHLTQPEFPDTNLQLKQECETSEIDPAGEDKANDSSETAKKRSRVSQKGKRNVRSKKNQRIGSDEDEDNDTALNTKQTSSSSSEEDESNDSQELSAKEKSALNLNGKTRASRGSATDPQSLYARKRRERINERLKILQHLVPNGTKVDISTMLEEAVQYVQFLQLQIKLLSSDDLWMYAPLAYNGMDIGRLEALDLKLNKPRC